MLDQQPRDREVTGRPPSSWPPAGSSRPSEAKAEYGGEQHRQRPLAAADGAPAGAARPLRPRAAARRTARSPASVAYVQCAGSRDQTLGVPYCSRVCCMYAIKQAMLLSGSLPFADTHRSTTWTSAPSARATRSSTARPRRWASSSSRPRSPGSTENDDQSVTVRVERIDDARPGRGARTTTWSCSRWAWPPAPTSRALAARGSARTASSTYRIPRTPRVARRAGHLRRRHGDRAQGHRRHDRRGGRARRGELYLREGAWPARRRAEGPRRAAPRRRRAHGAEPADTGERCRRSGAGWPPGAGDGAGTTAPRPATSRASASTSATAAATSPTSSTSRRWPTQAAGSARRGRGAGPTCSCAPTRARARSSRTSRRSDLDRVVVAACSPKLHETHLPGRARAGRPEPVPLRARQHPRAGELGARRPRRGDGQGGRLSCAPPSPRPDASRRSSRIARRRQGDGGRRRRRRRRPARRRSTSPGRPRGGARRARATCSAATSPCLSSLFPTEEAGRRRDHAAGRRASSAARGSPCYTRRRGE